MVQKGQKVFIKYPIVSDSPIKYRKLAKKISFKIDTELDRKNYLKYFC